MKLTTQITRLIIENTCKSFIVEDKNLDTWLQENNYKIVATQYYHKVIAKV
jgi:phage antirepressor YoqD-like protein